MNILNSIPLKNVILIAQAPEYFYPRTILEGSNQLFIGPDVAARTSNVGQGCPALHFDPSFSDGLLLNRALEEYGYRPDLIAIKADATRRIHVENLAALPGRKVLLMGDTHHMQRPLQTMLGYALSEPWDIISSEHDRHHLPLFREAGLNNLIWLPCFTMNPYRHEPRNDVERKAIFVGSLSPHHQYRQRLIHELHGKGLPINVTTASQMEAARLYNSCSISLNVSLNADLNFRVMEILAAGGCLLTDRLGPDSGLDLLLKEDVHYVGYSSAQEAADKIRWLLNDKDQRHQIAWAGYERFWSTFSPAIQSRALIDALQGQRVPELFNAPY